MKTIGMCKDCVSWTRTSTSRGKCSAIGEDHGECFGCVHWKAKEQLGKNLNPNYQPSTAEERMIEELWIENDCAVAKIKQLSKALVALGYDPTQLP